MKNKKVEKYTLEWALDLMKDNNVFAFEMTKEDYNKCFNNGLIADKHQRLNSPVMLGKPIRVKTEGEMSIIYKDVCPHCKRAY